MARKVRFCKQCHPGDTAFTGKFVPMRAYDFQAKVRDHTVENVAKRSLIAKLFGVTVGGFDQPFGSNVHLGKSGSLR